MIGRRLTRGAAIIALAFLAAAAWSAGGAFGQTAPQGYPTITLDRSTMHPGENIVVQFHGWRSAAVTLSVCGNLARRGSVDCNIVGSQGVPISHTTPENLTVFPVPVPPTTCPCVIRASNSDQTEIAYAPITLNGVPTGPLISPTEFSPLDVTVEAHRVGAGFGAALRSSLGGPAAYDVSVVLRNKSGETLTDVRPYGWAGRSKTDQARTLDFPSVGDLAPGQAWTHVFRVRTPAPHFGRFYFEVSVSGAGPAVHAESVARDTPWLLIAIVVLIVGDVAAMVGRRIRRRGAARQPAQEAPLASAVT